MLLRGCDRIFETESPYFLACTVVDWLLVFTRPETVNVLFEKLPKLDAPAEMNLHCDGLLLRMEQSDSGVRSVKRSFTVCVPKMEFGNEGQAIQGFSMKMSSILLVILTVSSFGCGQQFISHEPQEGRVFSEPPGSNQTRLSPIITLPISQKNRIPFIFTNTTNQDIVYCTKGGDKKDILYASLEVYKDGKKLSRDVVPREMQPLKENLRTLKSKESILLYASGLINYEIDSGNYFVRISYEVNRSQAESAVPRTEMKTQLDLHISFYDDSKKD